MQTMADVLGMPIRIHQHKHTCALGAAMFAAVVAGVYETVEQAMDAMGGGFDVSYEPNQANHEVYNQRYQQYRALGDFIATQVSAKHEVVAGETLQ